MEEDDAPGVPEWVVTYGDMMSLLLTFFIMLVSLSEVVADKKFRAVLESIQKYIGYRSAPTGPPGKSFPLNSTIKRLEILGSFAKNLNAAGGVRDAAPPGKNLRVLRMPDGKSFRIGEPLKFEPGKSTLLKESQLRLKRIISDLAGKPNKIEIRGHVSPEALPPDAVTHDRILLGYLRCQSVMRFMTQRRIGSGDIRIVSLGDTQPLETTNDKSKQFHDRVEIHILDKFSGYFRGSADTSK